MAAFHRLFWAAALGLTAPASPALARADDAAAVRSADGAVLVTWSAKDSIDVFMADRPVGDVASARLVSAADRDGRETIAVDAGARPYFLLRDRRDGSVTQVAERLVPLAQGSNFRDIGGYAAADGKHVRWGRIYRAGATPLLTSADLARVHALGLRAMVDLRSDEERVLAPTKIDGVLYAAVGYSMAEILRLSAQGPTGGLYARFPEMLAPQLRIVFGLLKRGEGPIVYNCSAGQDRTGFTTAMVLSALGVPRDTILRDYHLSTAYRQPRWEMPAINAAAFPDNPVAQMFARGQVQRAAMRPQPLYDAAGKSMLLDAFAAIDARYGSVDAYLQREIGVTAADIAALRAGYLE